VTAKADPDNLIGQRIRQWRGSHSQTWLCDQVPLAYFVQPVLSRVELGRRELTLMEAVHVAAALGMPMQTLVDGMTDSQAQERADIEDLRRRLEMVREALS
jgi:transcriptional regulator with XRE-family HTH domain